MVMWRRNSGRVISLLAAACVAACSAAPGPGAGDRPAAQNHTHPSTGAACFYSDSSGADRLAGGRVIHWCGPEPRPVF